MPRISPLIFLLDWIMVVAGLLYLSDSWGRRTVAKNFLTHFFPPLSQNTSPAFCPKSRPWFSSSCVLPSPASVLAFLHPAHPGCLPRAPQLRETSCILMFGILYHEWPATWESSCLKPIQASPPDMEWEQWCENDNDECNINHGSEDRGSYHVVRAYRSHILERAKCTYAFSLLDLSTRLT